MYKVLGIKKFTGKNGKSWVVLYLGFSDINVSGMCTKEFFLSADFCPSDLYVGDDIDIYLGLDGRVKEIKIN